MTSAREAESIILGHSISVNRISVALEQAAGQVLAEAVVADRDFPPFDRVTMDGVALKYEAFKEGTRAFTIEGVEAAGVAPLTLQSRTGAIEVMTGAVLPTGTNCVIRFEDVTIENGVAHVQIPEIQARQNIHPKGQDVTQGSVLLPEGCVLSPAEVALLATVGKKNIVVFDTGPVAIVSTGNELVEVDEQPFLWQIRQSNSYALQAALREMGIGSNRFHWPDDADQMEEKLIGIFQKHAIVLITGGVSKGKYDFVPTVLSRLNIEKQFHQVAQKPGKPFWFGKSTTHTVFALPGNPVSTYLCFYKYLRPWLNKIRGVQATPLHAQLAKDFQFAPPLTYFLQVKVVEQEGVLRATPLEGGGSGDFANLKDVSGFLELPSDRSQFLKDEIFPFIPIR